MAKLQPGDDPLITFLTIKKQKHQSKIDRSFVKSVFESYSTKIEKEEDAQASEEKDDDC